MYSYKTLADFLEDRVVYRSLEPSDPTLPKLSEIWADIGLETHRIPRKTEPIYAAAVYRMLQTAQANRGLPPLERILFIGDTLLNDGTSAKNLADYLPMRCFIGSEKQDDAEKIEIDGSLMIANKWAALNNFLTWVQAEGFTFDNRTALIVDLDKTSLGARGRNHSIIDKARVTAVQQTAEVLLGDKFDENAFRAVYDRLNQVKYHPFTGDNQDFLAYISLMVAGDVYIATKFWDDVDSNRLTSLKQFVTLCDAQQFRMSEGLQTAHREVTGNIAKDDPTPFKSFRYREYQATIELMNILPDDSPLNEVLAKEIVMTGEVAELAETLVAQGVITFGLSDKPDEASIPQDATKPPLHKVIMKVVGSL